MNQSEIIKKIHNEFDTSVDKLIKFSEDVEKYCEKIKIDEIDKNEKEEGEFLSEIGFSNAIKVKEFSEKKNSIEKVQKEKEEKMRLCNGLKTSIDNWSVKLPGYKIITYSQVVNICEKYGLVLGPADQYIGEIPSKNVNDIRNYEKVKKHDFSIPLNTPLFTIDKVDKVNERSSYDPWRGIATPNPRRDSNYFICAPLSDFNKKDNILVGRELVNFPEEKFNWETPKKIQDPIILDIIDISPLKEVGFAIVTAWGDEASDEIIVNEKNN